MYNLTGLTPYETAWRYQKVLSEHIHQKRSLASKFGDNASACFEDDYLLLVEHPRIFTLGRGASEKNIKFKFNNDTNETQSSHDSSLMKEDEDKVEVVRVERGGEVTWHGPGQLVAYPILDLNHFKRDLHWFTNALEETVIRAVSRVGIHGERSDVNTGVWVGNNKLSAVGVTASRWITMHGSSLNVCCNMMDFTRIVPCGITVPGRGVCSLKQLKPDLSADMDIIRLVYAEAFADTFLLTPLGIGGGGNDSFTLVTADEARNELQALLAKYPAIEYIAIKSLFSS